MKQAALDTFHQLARTRKHSAKSDSRKCLDLCDDILQFELPYLLTSKEREKRLVVFV